MKLTIHYALSDLGNTDIPSKSFDNFHTTLHFLDKFLNEKTDENSVWLLCWGESPNGEYDDDVLVTDHTTHLIPWITEVFFNELVDAQDDDCVMNLFLQEYTNFEDAYSVALSMRENKPNCYDQTHELN